MSGLLLPFDAAAPGERLIACIVITRKADRTLFVDFRLADGEVFDEDDPVHCMASFIAQNAQRIAATACQYRDRARAAGRRAEKRIVSLSQGA
mgnify:CR=1 FL=1